MSELVTIKPRSGSRKFSSVGSMTTVYTESNENGEIKKELKSNFDGQRFPGSKPFFRIPWGHNKRKWLLDGFEENCQSLNDLVKETRLQYEKGKNQGDYILKADIWDPNDAFFTHRSARLMTKEGEILLDKANPLHNLILRGLKKHPWFVIGGEDNPLLTASARYVIVDKAIDIASRKKARASKLEVIKLYESLTSEKKKKIAMAMGLIPNEKVDSDVVDDILFKAAEDNVTRITDAKMTRQELFVKFCKMETEDLNLKHRIQKAKSLGILKRQQNVGWLLLGSPVGKTMEQIEEYLKNPDNQEMLIKLEDAIKYDKS